MKVTNMTSPQGNPVSNQFIIEDVIQIIDPLTPPVVGAMFQSYKSNIAFKEYTRNDGTHKVYLDKTYWNYSATTSKYRDIFLNEDTATTKRKIASGEYILTNLN